jgi:hypothetical protein
MMKRQQQQLHVFFFHTLHAAAAQTMACISSNSP